MYLSRIIGVIGFETGMSVFVQRRDIPYMNSSNTWYEIGRCCYRAGIDPERVLPSSLVKLLKASLNKPEDFINTQIIIGDYLSGWYDKENESYEQKQKPC